MYQSNKIVGHRHKRGPRKRSCNDCNRSQYSGVDARKRKEGKTKQKPVDDMANWLKYKQTKRLRKKTVHRFHPNRWPACRNKSSVSQVICAICGRDCVNRIRMHKIIQSKGKANLDCYILICKFIIIVKCFVCIAFSMAGIWRRFCACAQTTETFHRVTAPIGQPYMRIAYTV